LAFNEALKATIMMLTTRFKDYQMELKNTSRLSELDWLRVILIFAVFVHHICMPFNGENWHIMNNESSKVLDDVMVYFEQFRLPILFFIAGVGAVILLSKVTAKNLH
jgi:glucan biosynthesis protein C